jgi:hypothetical protein
MRKGRKGSARGRLCGMYKCTNYRTSATAHFCNGHEMEEISVERWIGDINLGGQSTESLRDFLNAEAVTEIEDLTDMTEGELSGLDLNGRVLKKLRLALHKLGNNQILKSDGRGSITSGPPLPPAFSEKWRIQVKLFEVAASAMTTGKLIGSGGFARVYEGSINGVPVAIKKFEVSSDQHEQYIGMIKRETRPLSRVRHPNVIQLHHVCLEIGHLAIATELAPNGSLDEYLQTYPDTSLAQRFFFGHGIVAGMNRLHANQPKPILHNDLKPANVLVGAMLEPKIKIWLVDGWAHNNHQWCWCHRQHAEIRGARAARREGEEPEVRRLRIWCDILRGDDRPECVGRYECDRYHVGSGASARETHVSSGLPSVCAGDSECVLGKRPRTAPEL